MTNKIIGALAAMVVALSIVAYNLWQEEPVESDAKPMVKVKGNVDSHALESTADKDTSEPQQQVAESSDSATEETLTEAVEKKENKNKVLCELAYEYDDWYQQGDIYESDNFMRDVKSWAFSRGYFETEYSKGGLEIKKKSDYDYYEIDALEDMAKAGDSMANVRLAYKLYLKGDRKSMERAQPYCDKAIVDGYTALLICKSSNLARQIYDEQRKEEQLRNQELLKELELDFLAWRGVATELDDKLGETLSTSLLADLEYEFTDKNIKQRTQQLIGGIRSRRAELGLGPMKHPPMPKLLEHVLENKVDSEDALNVCFE
ncbi:hypothetical protein [Kangiella sediminilitoris]|uniref:Uncharacterized protein n=1 Tax=Kangiella sediminilitoris TaxID=1144748 RepID=A0A1B3B7W7_9GAMM|nr:hypothetical protein [Kangiella sediminilitoris]AOE48884.1 hypothetical protein KS2013_155 [Kangiella sediminilitoris]